MMTTIKTKFGYYPLVWIFYGRILNIELITYTSAHYELYIETIQVLFMNCSKKTILS